MVAKSLRDAIGMDFNSLLLGQHWVQTTRQVVGVPYRLFERAIDQCRLVLEQEVDLRLVERVTRESAIEPIDVCCSAVYSDNVTAIGWVDGEGDSCADVNTKPIQREPISRLSSKLMHSGDG
jgi:hypothetical protein